MVQFASAVEMLVKSHQDKPEVLQAHVQPVLMRTFLVGLQKPRLLTRSLWVKRISNGAVRCCDGLQAFLERVSIQSRDERKDQARIGLAVAAALECYYISDNAKHLCSPLCDLLYAIFFNCRISRVWSSGTSHTASEETRIGDRSQYLRRGLMVRPRSIRGIESTTTDMAATTQQNPPFQHIVCFALKDGASAKEMHSSMMGLQAGCVLNGEQCIKRIEGGANISKEGVSKGMHVSTGATLRAVGRFRADAELPAAPHSHRETIAWVCHVV